MPSPLSPGQRLRLLQAAQPDRPWHSCAERRQCVACNRTFTGEQVKVRWLHDQVIGLSCPGCGSPPQLWVRLGNPLLNGRVWEDWEQAMSSLTRLEDALA